jgi:hypothetical protein
MKSPAK